MKVCRFAALCCIDFVTMLPPRATGYNEPSSVPNDRTDDASPLRRLRLRLIVRSRRIRWSLTTILYTYTLTHANVLSLRRPPLNQAAVGFSGV